MIDEILEDAAERMQGAIDVLQEDLHGYRTGRASPQFVEKVQVEMYGVTMNLRDLANISTPEPQQLMIRPYDKKGLGAIERAILAANIGLTPNNNGEVIYLNMPRLTEERRREMTQLLGRRLEDAKVAVRNVRRSALEALRKAQHDGDITEDDLHYGQELLQEVTDEHTGEIDRLGQMKRDEIMSV